VPSISIRGAGDDESRDVQEEVEMFIIHDTVDLFALFGMVRVGRLVWKLGHKYHSHSDR
jgi:hypothetical protein